ncbi:MAG: DUF4919 domain-containing protein [Rikenellaceae bacterium]
MEIIRRFVVVLCAALCVDSAVGQTPPDMDVVRAAITNPASDYYYESLFERYEALDSTLTFDDYFHLYYGFAEQVSYMPLLDNTARTELEEILSGRSTPTVSDYERAIVLINTILTIEPFNLRDINALAYVYAMVGDESRAEQLMQRVEVIAQVIMSTGTGLAEKEPWWIIYFAHAEDIVSLLGHTQQGIPIIISKDVELLSIVKEKGRKQKGCYFNYSLIYARDADYLENIDAPKRKMYFNPLNAKPEFKY